MRSRNGVNLLADKRTNSVNLDKRQNILDKSGLIFPKIPNSNIEKKIYTLQIDNDEDKSYSSLKPSRFLEMQRSEIENKLFQDRLDIKRNYGFENFKNFQTLEERERSQKNKSLFLPSTKKNFLTEVKYKPIDSFSLLKETLNLKLTNSSSLSNYISKNILLKDKLIQNLKKNMTFEKIFKRHSENYQHDSLQTLNYTTLSPKHKHEISLNTTEKKNSSLKEFQKIFPLSRINLNNPTKFENEAKLIQKENVNNFSFEATTEKEEKTSNERNTVLSKEITKSETFDFSKTYLNIFVDYERKLDDHLRSINKFKLQKHESQNRVIYYKDKYLLYKTFCQEIISNHPESANLINKILLDFDEIINNLIEEYNESTGKIEKMEKIFSSNYIFITKFNFKEFTNLNVKYHNKTRILKEKEAEILKLKKKIKDYEIKIKKDPFIKKSHSVNNKNTIEYINSSKTKILIKFKEYFSTELDEIHFLDKVHMKTDLKDKESLIIPKLDLSFNYPRNYSKKMKNSFVDYGNFATNDFSKISKKINAPNFKENKENQPKTKNLNLFLKRNKLIQNMKMKKKMNNESNSSLNMMDMLKKQKAKITNPTTDTVLKKY